MTELLDNALQLLCVTLCGLYSLFATVTKRNYKWLLVTLFYLSFGIGLAYWVLYLVLFNSSPRVFFVAELNWVASYIFLAMRLVLSLSGEERKMRSKPVFWLLPAFSLVMCVFFCFRSSYLENIFMGAALAVCGFLAVKGLSLRGAALTKNLISSLRRSFSMRRNIYSGYPPILPPTAHCLTPIC